MMREHEEQPASGIARVDRGHGQCSGVAARGHGAKFVAAIDGAFIGLPGLDESPHGGSAHAIHPWLEAL